MARGYWIITPHSSADVALMILFLVLPEYKNPESWKIALPSEEIERKKKIQRKNGEFQRDFVSVGRHFGFSCFSLRNRR